MELCRWTICKEKPDEEELTRNKRKWKKNKETTKIRTQCSLEAKEEREANVIYHSNIGQGWILQLEGQWY